MKTSAWLNLLLCCLFLNCAAASETVREFRPPPGQPKISGYAETKFISQRLGKTISFHARLWFQGSKRYRIESEDSYNPDMRVLTLSDGRHAFNAVVFAGRTRPPKWDSFPVSWFGSNLLEFHLQHPVPMRRAKMIDSGWMHGLPVDHWRGAGVKSDTVTIDLWVSADSKFPLVLRWEMRSPISHAVWQISQLDIRNPVPDYVFTPQLHPRPGVLPLLATRYWPPRLVLIWHVLCLICYLGFIMSTASLARKPDRRCALLSVFWGICVLGLLLASPQIGEYFYLLSDTPLLLQMSAFTAAFLIVAWRRAGAPGTMNLFKGTRWAVIVFTAIAALAGIASAGSRQTQIAHIWQLKSFSLPFLPQLLINVVIFCIESVTVQELVFRGYLLQALNTRFSSPRMANALQAAAFSLYHIPRDLILYGIGLRMVIDLTFMFAFGMLFGFLRLRYRNLGVPWLVHLAYNVAFFYVTYAAQLGLLQGLMSTFK